MTPEQARAELARRELTRRESQSMVKETIPVLTKREQNLQNSEKAISSRPSMMADLIKDPSTLQRLVKHPLGTTLRTIGGAAELAEGIPADVGLALQKGDISTIPQDIYNTAIGKRPAQYGDIARGAGIPEPLADTMGLLASANKFSPSSMVGEGTLAGFNKITKAPQFIEKFGKPVLSRAMSIFSGVPQNSMDKALSNPRFLSKNWLSKEAEKVKSLYKKTVQPLIDDSTKRVDTSSLSNISDDLGIMSKSGQFTKTFNSMKPSEQSKFLKWENKIVQGVMSFNEADSIIGEIDSALKSVYKSKEKGLPVDYSDDFLRTISTMRDKLNSIRKAQYPDAGKVIDRYSTYSVGKSVYKNFDRWLPHLMPSIVAGAALGGMGVGNPQIYSAAILGAIPKLQGLGIRAGSVISKQIPKVAPQVAMDLWRKSKS